MRKYKASFRLSAMRSAFAITASASAGLSSSRAVWRHSSSQRSNMAGSMVAAWRR
jgi:hypothetical protein